MGVPVLLVPLLVPPGLALGVEPVVPLPEVEPLPDAPAPLLLVPEPLLLPPDIPEVEPELPEEAPLLPPPESSACCVSWSSRPVAFMPFDCW